MFVLVQKNKKTITMYKILQHFHIGWAYLTVLAAFVFLFMIGFYVINKKARDSRITKLSLITTIIFHVQLLIGVILYFVSPFAKWGPTTMKDSNIRLYAMEHPLMMFAAVILITVVNSKLKKSAYVKLPLAIMTLVAVLLVLSRIPWDAWLG